MVQFINATAKTGKSYEQIIQKELETWVAASAKCIWHIVEEEYNLQDDQYRVFDLLWFFNI